MAKYFLGIDLGGTNIAAAVMDESYHFLSTHKTPTLAQRPFEVIVADMANAGHRALEKAGIGLADLEHVGIGVPSTVNPTNKNVVFANNLGWLDRDVVGEFKKHMNVPTYIANDADCAAYGEALAGAAKDYDSVLMLTLGTGVGGGIILNKKIFLGGNGFGCEPGHTIILENGQLCTCGRLGCLEAYASVTALIRDTICAMAANPTSIMHQMCESDLTRVSGRTAFDAARQGDSAATTVVETYIFHLAVGISNYITLLRPEVVILGGGVCNEGENLLAPLRNRVNDMLYATHLMPETPIIRAALGNDAGIVGAAFLGKQYE